MGPVPPASDLTVAMRRVTDRSRTLSQIVFTVAPDGTARPAWSPAAPQHQAQATTHIDDVVDPVQREFVRQTLAWVFERGESFGFELHGLYPRHPGAWFQCCLVPNVASGQVVSATMVATDVTGHKERELEWEREREELIRLANRPDPSVLLAEDSAGPLPRLMDGFSEAVLLIDGTTQRIVDANSTACRWLRRSREDLLRQPADEVANGMQLVPAADADDGPFTETRSAPRARVRHGVCRRSDGTPFAVQSTLTPVRLNGAEYILAVVRDAQQAADLAGQAHELGERYRWLFDSSADGVFLLSRSGTVLEANPAAATLFGRPRGDLAGMNVRHLLLLRPDSLAYFQERSRRMEPVRDIPARVRRPDEWRLSALLSTLPLRTADGGLRGYQCLLRIPERGRGGRSGGAG